MTVDPEKEITVTCGATEAMAAVFMALLDPGDEVIVFEPFYENYGPDAILAGATPRFVRLNWPDWSFDPEELRAAFNDRTRAIIVNTPHNPTGKVFTREELSLIADLCIGNDVWAITDEIYEHIRYAGNHHVLATFPGMRERTITISGLSKTFSCTGWRMGFAIAPARESVAIRKVHDFLTVGAPAPLQQAGAVGMAFDAEYYNKMALDYRAKREILCDALTAAGFSFTPPDGAYYILADYSRLSDLGDTEFAIWLTREAGVATVPGSSFHLPGAQVPKYIRFAFCKKPETLAAAAERLARIPELV
jgi:aminotransferase